MSQSSMPSARTQIAKQRVSAERLWSEFSIYTMRRRYWEAQPVCVLLFLSQRLIYVQGCISPLHTMDAAVQKVLLNAVV